MALGGDAADGLDAQDRHGAMRPAVHGLLALAVAFHAVTRDARGGDRQLRHATGRNVDLEDPPIAHRPILAAGIMATPARPAASGDEEPD